MIQEAKQLTMAEGTSQKRLSRGDLTVTIDLDLNSFPEDAETDLEWDFYVPLSSSDEMEWDDSAIVPVKSYHFDLNDAICGTTDKIQIHLGPKEAEINTENRMLQSNVSMESLKSCKTFWSANSCQSDMEKRRTHFLLQLSNKARCIIEQTQRIPSFDTNNKPVVSNVVDIKVLVEGKANEANTSDSVDCIDACLNWIQGNVVGATVVNPESYKIIAHAENDESCFSNSGSNSRTSSIDVCNAAQKEIVDEFMELDFQISSNVSAQNAIQYYQIAFIDTTDGKHDDMTDGMHCMFESTELGSNFQDNERLKASEPEECTGQMKSESNGTFGGNLFIQTDIQKTQDESDFQLCDNKSNFDELFHNTADLAIAEQFIQRTNEAIKVLYNSAQQMDSDRDDILQDNKEIPAFDYSVKAFGKQEEIICNPKPGPTESSDMDVRDVEFEDVETISHDREQTASTGESLKEQLDESLLQEAEPSYIANDDENANTLKPVSHCNILIGDNNTEDRENSSETEMNDPKDMMLPDSILNEDSDLSHGYQFVSENQSDKIEGPGEIKCHELSSMKDKQVSQANGKNEAHAKPENTTTESFVSENEMTQEEDMLQYDRYKSKIMTVVPDMKSEETVLNFVESVIGDAIKVSNSQGTDDFYGISKNQIIESEIIIPDNDVVVSVTDSIYIIGNSEDEESPQNDIESRDMLPSGTISNCDNLVMSRPEAVDYTDNSKTEAVFDLPEESNNKVLVLQEHAYSDKIESFSAESGKIDEKDGNRYQKAENDTQDSIRDSCDTIPGTSEESTEISIGESDMLSSGTFNDCEQLVASGEEVINCIDDFELNLRSEDLKESNNKVWQEQGCSDLSENKRHNDDNDTLVSVRDSSCIIADDIHDESIRNSTEDKGTYNDTKQLVISGAKIIDCLDSSQIMTTSENLEECKNHECSNIHASANAESIKANEKYKDVSHNGENNAHISVRDSSCTIAGSIYEDSVQKVTENKDIVLSDTNNDCELLVMGDEEIIEYADDSQTMANLEKSSSKVLQEYECSAIIASVSAEAIKGNEKHEDRFDNVSDKHSSYIIADSIYEVSIQNNMEDKDLLTSGTNNDGEKLAMGGQEITDYTDDSQTIPNNLEECGSKEPRSSTMDVSVSLEAMKHDEKHEHRCDNDEDDELVSITDSSCIIADSITQESIQNNVDDKDMLISGTNNDCEQLVIDDEEIIHYADDSEMITNNLEERSSKEPRCSGMNVSVSAEAIKDDEKPEYRCENDEIDTLIPVRDSSCIITESIYEDSMQKDMGNKYIMPADRGAIECEQLVSSGGEIIDYPEDSPNLDECTNKVLQDHHKCNNLHVIAFVEVTDENEKEESKWPSTETDAFVSVTDSSCIVSDNVMDESTQSGIERKPIEDQSDRIEKVICDNFSAVTDSLVNEYSPIARYPVTESYSREVQDAHDENEDVTKVPVAPGMVMTQEEDTLQYEKYRSKRIQAIPDIESEETVVSFVESVIEDATNILKSQDTIVSVIDSDGIIALNTEENSQQGHIESKYTALSGTNTDYEQLVRNIEEAIDCADDFKTSSSENQEVCNIKEHSCSNTDTSYSIEVTKEDTTGDTKDQKPGLECIAEQKSLRHHHTMTQSQDGAGIEDRPSECSGIARELVILDGRNMQNEDKYNSLMEEHDQETVEIPLCESDSIDEHEDLLQYCHFRSSMICQSSDIEYVNIDRESVASYVECLLDDTIEIFCNKLGNQITKRDDPAKVSEVEELLDLHRCRSSTKPPTCTDNAVPFDDDSTQDQSIDNRIPECISLKVEDTLSTSEHYKVESTAFHQEETESVYLPNSLSKNYSDSVVSDATEELQNRDFEKRLLNGYPFHDSSDENVDYRSEKAKACIGNAVPSLESQVQPSAIATIGCNHPFDNVSLVKQEKMYERAASPIKHKGSTDANFAQVENEQVEEDQHHFVASVLQVYSRKSHLPVSSSSLAQGWHLKQKSKFQRVSRKKQN